MRHQPPRAILGRMRRPASIMGSKPCFEIAGDADVALVLDCEALDEVDAFHESVPLRTPTKLCFGGQPSLKPPSGWLASRSFSEGWWRAGELNPRPLRCERSALPTELAPHSTVLFSLYFRYLVVLIVIYHLYTNTLIWSILHRNAAVQQQNGQIVR